MCPPPPRYLPILGYQSGNGKACPSQSALTQVAPCTVPSPPQCTACTDGLVDPGDADVDCGQHSGCMLCGEGLKCADNADCATGLVCGSINTCIRTCVVVVLLCVGGEG